MIRSIFLFTLIIVTATSVNAQNLDFIDFKVSSDQNVWTYSVTRSKSIDSLVVQLEIPRSAFAKKVTSKINDSLMTPKTEYSLRQKRSICGNLQLEFSLLDTQNQTITFEVIAPKNVTKNGKIGWTIKANSKENKGSGPGPIGLGNPIIRYVLTGGYSLKGNSRIDFKVENGAVLIENYSRKQHSFSAGIVLNVLNLNNKLSADLLLSAEFGVDSSRVIDGFISGVTVQALQFRKFRLPELFVGISFRTEQKLRSGFKDVAKKLVKDINEMDIKALSALNTKDNKITPKAIKWNFDRFKKLLKNCEKKKNCENKINVKVYDGFPIIDPRNKEPIFYGTPLIDRINWAFVFGVIVPLDIGNWVPNWIGKRLGG